MSRTAAPLPASSTVAPVATRAVGLGLTTALTVLLSACTSPPMTHRPSPPPAPAAPPASAPTTSAPLPASPAPGGVRASLASDPRSYRKDAAQHLYALNGNRIFSGKLPPLLYAVGVMEVELDGRGQVRRFGWLRAPRHAPEVMAEIERTVRQAAPFPAPARMGKVTYVDTWLWDRSGRFQLDTLTEGQRSEL